MQYGTAAIDCDQCNPKKRSLFKLAKEVFMQEIDHLTVAIVLLFSSCLVVGSSALSLNVTTNAENQIAYYESIAPTLAYHGSVAGVTTLRDCVVDVVDAQGNVIQCSLRVK